MRDEPVKKPDPTDLESKFEAIRHGENAISMLKNYAKMKQRVENPLNLRSHVISGKLGTKLGLMGSVEGSIGLPLLKRNWLR